MEAAAEAIGYIGLPNESYASIGEMLRDKELNWTALQIILSLARNTNLYRGHAEEIVRLVDVVLYGACTSVKESGPDDQYLIADCVEVLVRAGGLCGRDAIRSFRHIACGPATSWMRTQLRCFQTVSARSESIYRRKPLDFSTAS